MLTHVGVGVEAEPTREKNETHAKVGLLIYRSGRLLFTCVRTFCVPHCAQAPRAYDEYVIPVLSTALNFDLLTAK